MLLSYYSLLATLKSIIYFHCLTVRDSNPRGANCGPIIRLVRLLRNGYSLKCFWKTPIFTVVLKIFELPKFKTFQRPFWSHWMKWNLGLSPVFKCHIIFWCFYFISGVFRQEYQVRNCCSGSGRSSASGCCRSSCWDQYCKTIFCCHVYAK